jgi:hypothetical protein
VDGFIYLFGHNIYSFGRINKTAAIRCTILRDAPKGGGDMIGLRLGVSVDMAPYAHRLYCAFLGKADRDDLTSLTGSWAYDEAVEKIKNSVPDIESVAALLKSEPSMSQALVLPSRLFE